MIRAILSAIGALLLAHAPVTAPQTMPPTGTLEPIVTILADFETDSVAASLVDARNVPAADCKVERVAIPARGQQSLMVEIGATVPNTSVACELAYRIDAPIDAPQRAAVFCWLNGGQASVGFRLRDSRGRVFETAPEPVAQTRRWQRLSVALTNENLTAVAAGGEAGEARGATGPALPLEIVGLRVTTTQVGHQAVFLDDVQVEHLAPPEDMLRGEFRFDEVTRLYAPGAQVAVEMELENCSHKRRCQAAVDLLWLDQRDQVVAKSTGRAVLPPSSPDFRSRQSVHISQKLAEPGLYRLLARVRNDQAQRVREFESSAAVFQSNRLLSRGRNIFFAARSNLLREARPDRLAEIRVAREVGVQLLALDVPWGLLEPSAGQYRLERLDEVLAAAAERDMAVMLTISQPPEWANEPAARRTAQLRLLDKLARQAMPKAAYFQPLDFDAVGVALGTELAYITELRDALKAAAPRATLVAPPIDISGTPPRAPPPDIGKSNVIWTFETAGLSSDALEAMRRYAAQHKLNWSSDTWWQHRGSTLSSVGRQSDAAALLEHYVEAARAGVGALIWSDVRDDSSDARRADAQRGLVARDFGPKEPLLGCASTIGELAGMRYAHALPGTPPEFDTALFIAGTRQTAVIRPKPNRIRPALLAPITGLAGTLSMVDFLRRPVPVPESGGPTLVSSRDEPFFISINFEKIEPQPRVQLAKPWLRVPAMALCSPDTPLRVEVDAPFDLRRSFVQVALPPEAPFTTDVSTRTLRAAAGETAAVAIPLSPISGRSFEQSSLTIRVSLEGQATEIPVAVRPVHAIRAGTVQADDACKVGVLAARGEAGGPALGTVYAAYQPAGLELIIALPETPGSDDQLQVAAAVAGDARAREAVLTARPAGQDAAAALPSGWNATWSKAAGAPETICHLKIAASAFEKSAFEANELMLISIEYERRNAMNVRTTYGWGGFAGADLAREGVWVRLAPVAAPR